VGRSDLHAGRTRFHVILGERHAVGRRRHPGRCQRDAVNGQLTAGMRERKGRIARDERRWRKVNRGSGEVNRGSRRVNRGSSAVNLGHGSSERGCLRRNALTRCVHVGRRRFAPGECRVEPRVVRVRARGPRRNLLTLAPLLGNCRGRRFATKLVRWGTTLDARVTLASHLAARRGVFARAL